MKIVDINGNSYRKDSDVLDTVPLETRISERVKPRQVGSGTMRGAQIIPSDAKAKLVNGYVPDTQDAFGQTFYDSDGVRRMLFGNYPDGNVKAKLSQEGYDVLTATDDQLIWSSDFNSFKIVESGTATIPANAAGADTQYVIVQTGLDFNPVVIAYVTELNYQFPIPSIGTGLSLSQSWTYIVGLDGIGAVRFTYSQDATGAANPSGQTVRYYLLREITTGS